MITGGRIQMIFRTAILTILCLLPAHYLQADVYTASDVKALRTEAASDRRFAEDRKSKALQWQEMAENARQQAKSAKRSEEQRRLQRKALEYDDEVAALEAEAERLNRRAAKKEQRARELETQLDDKAQGEARRQAELEAQMEALREKDRARKRAEPPYRLSLDNVIGVWRFKDSNDPFVIVPQDPDSVLSRYKLEAHSNERVWQGEHTSLPTGHPGRTQEAGLVFNYMPKADEMNPTIPIWVRRAVEGELKWRIEIDEVGDEFDPRFSLKWFPGEVEWKEDGASRSASVIGNGEVREYELEPDYLLDIKSLANAGLRLTLGGQHDPDADPLQSLLKGQPFFVKVSLPPKLAKQQGNSLKVSLRGLGSGDETTLELTGASSGSATRPVIYSHPDAVTIADCDTFTNIPREPQFLSLLWIFGQSGSCLDLDVDNNELVEVRYGESYQQVNIYNSWVQSGLAYHRQGRERLKLILGPILSGNYTHAQKEQAHRRMRMLVNYQHMINSDSLTDLHRYHLGELYLGDTAGKPGIVLMSDEALAALAANRGMKPRSTDPDYFNPLMKAYLEGLSGKNLDPKAHLVTDDIIFTSEHERKLARTTLLRVSKGLQSKVVRTAAKEFSFGMYEGLVSATPAGSIYLVATGHDHFNRKVPTWVRLITAVGLASDVVLHFSSASKARSFMGKPLKRKTLGAPAESKVTLLANRNQGVRPVGNLQDSANLPASLNDKKRTSAALPLEPDPPGKGGAGCSLRSTQKQKPRTLQHPGKAAPKGLPDADLMEQLQVEEYTRRIYGSDFEFVDSEKVFDIQGPGKPTCNMMASNYAVWKKHGIRISEERGHKMIMRQMMEDYVAGKVTPDDFIFNEYGIVGGSGYPQGRIRRYLRALGAKVADIGHTLNSRVKLRHIWSALEQGWNVKVVIKTGHGIHDLHAVIVDSLVVNAKTKKVSKVILYDPNIGRRIKVPARKFDSMIATQDPLGWGILTLFRWDD